VRRPVDEHPIKTLSSEKQKDEQNTVYKHETVDVLGIPVSVFTRSELTASCLEILKSQKRGWISYVNVHTIDVAKQLLWYKQFMVDALVRYCDGEGVRFGAYLLGKHIPERMTLSDYIYDLADASVEHNLNIFLLGGTQVVVELAANRLKELYPTIRLSGYHHGYFSEQENNSVIEEINACKPDILFLCMGVPKQEEWTKENFNKLNAKIIWMGGGFLDTLSDKIKRCPQWLKDVGFEWLFRFIQEPRRLWKRYLIGNPKFIMRILQSRIHRR
jgi:N-acetylglucosaminyldiphosphoundecaprenol N-acetyl-beta-D-mannosaminyltransferase